MTWQQVTSIAAQESATPSPHLCHCRLSNFVVLSPHSPQWWRWQACNKQSTVDQPTIYIFQYKQNIFAFLNLIIFCLHFVRGIDKILAFRIFFGQPAYIYIYIKDYYPRANCKRLLATVLQIYHRLDTVLT